MASDEDKRNQSSCDRSTREYRTWSTEESSYCTVQYTIPTHCTVQYTIPSPSSTAVWMISCTGTGTITAKAALLSTHSSSTSPPRSSTSVAPTTRAIGACQHMPLEASDTDFGESHIMMMMIDRPRTLGDAPGGATAAATIFEPDNVDAVNRFTDSVEEKRS